MNPAEGYTPDAWVRAVVRAIWRSVLIAAAIAGAVYALWRLKPVIIAMLVAGALAYIIRPVAGSLARHRWFLAGLSYRARRIVATLLVVVLLFVAAYYVTRAIASPFVQQAQEFTRNYPRLKRQARKLAGDVRGWYESNVPAATRTWVEEQVVKSGGEGELDVRAQATAWAQEALRRVVGALRNIVEIVLLPVLAFYFALDSRKIKHEFAGALPRRFRREVLRMIHVFNQIMYRYVVGQAILCILAGIVVGLGLWALQVPYTLTLALLAGLTRAIPIIGPILGGIPIVLLALISKGFYVGLAVLIFFTILHFAESKFLMPWLIGDRMELHPVVIIVVLLIGEEFGGLLGMFFAPPLAAILRVIVRRYWLQNHVRPALPVGSVTGMGARP